MAVWKRLPNWTYELFEAETPAARFGAFEPLVALWHAKRADAGLPAWSDFDFFDFKGWHGRIAVQEIVTDPFDLRCRLWGTELTEILGSDNTGKLFSDLGSGYTDNDLGYLNELCRTGSIGRSHGSLDWLQKGYKSVAFLDLPLADDGATPTHLLTALTEAAVA